LSYSYGRSKFFQNFSIEIAFREKVQKRICKTVQNIFSSAASNGTQVHCMWIIFTKLKLFASVVSVIVWYIVIMVQIK